ncbi:MAG: glycosyltransferase family 4 protein [Coprococcus sp.]|nr:glycosyltransferase family 4 protein [Coprococcus sp.]
MKRIAFFITKLGHGGAERVATILANEFAKDPRYEVNAILTYDNEDSYQLLNNIKSFVLPFHKSHMLRIIKRQIAVHQLLKRIAPDIVVSIPEGTTPYIVIDHFFSGRYATVFSQRQDPELEYNSAFKKLLANIRYMCATSIVFQTDEQKKFFWETAQKKSTVILNPIKENLPIRNANMVCNEIVTFCRLEKEKNLTLLIDSFSMLADKHTDFTLKIWGKGSEEEALRAYIAQSGLQKRVLLMGYSANIHNEIKDAYMYVNSSNHEGISNAMLESMAIGLPVICTDCPCGGARVVINDGINGILIPMNSTIALSGAMERLINDRDYACQMSEEAKKARTEYSLEKIVDKWKKVVEEAIAKG